MKRPAFTLVELLVTITIIGILAATATGVLIVARGSAREAATKVTITKLHTIIMAKYESYLSRRLPMDGDDLRWVASNKLGWKPASTLDPVPTRILALARLQAMRDLMRMEMPDRASDLTDAPIFFPPGFTGTGRWLTYRAAYKGSQHPSARMLYLIVAVGSEGREAGIRFLPSEKADTDGDGRADVFVDGWGRPIYWLRWAPGFDDSDIQSQSTDPTNHDRSDPLMVDAGAFRLVPLIYSAGSDGEYGVWQDTKSPDPPYHWTGNIYATIDDTNLGRSVRMGEIISDGAFDNLTNHRLEPER